MKLHPPPAQMSFSHAACRPPHFLFSFFVFLVFLLYQLSFQTSFFPSGKHYKAPLLLHIESVAFCFFFNWSFCGKHWKDEPFLAFCLDYLSHLSILDTH